ncbi:MAG: hypothetical protein AAFN93_21135 [Bacteroidota bacterium]
MKKVYKKVLNIIELVIVMLIVLGVLGFNEDTNSVSRFSSNSSLLRIGIDILIIAILLYRFIQIIKNFNKEYSELGGLRIFEKMTYGCCLILLLPDLAHWYQWSYFADLYSHFFVVFSLPIILWAIEIIERIRFEKSKIRSYGLAILSFAIPLIVYTIYLSQIN